VLDVTMGEDACPIYRGDAVEILTCIRHMALNMLRAETSRKASIRRKQKIACMSSEYLEAVLTAGIQKLAVS
ncbi:transposase, partial [Aeromonas cavernicola]